MNRLQGKRAIVTGAAQGQGAAIAQEEPFVEFENSPDPGPGGLPLVTEEQYFDPALLPPPESEIDRLVAGLHDARKVFGLS